MNNSNDLFALLLARTKSGGGGGGGGSDDYRDLSHKPQINNHTLNGSMTSADLGITSANDTTITVKVTGENDQTFTTNQSSASNITVNVPVRDVTVGGTSALDTSTHTVALGSAAGSATTDFATSAQGGKADSAVQTLTINNSATGVTKTGDAVDISAVPATIVSAGKLANNMEATTQSASDNSDKLATTKYVDTAVGNLPKPMVYTGAITLTADSTDTTKASITVTAPASASNIKEGFTYKVATIASSPAYTGTLKVGDTFIAAKNAPTVSASWVADTDWNVIPSGDEPSGTVIQVSTGAGLTGGPVTTSGTIKANLQSETAFGGAAASVTPGSITTNIQPVLTDSNGKLAVKVDKSDVGLGNVTNDAQVKKISSAVSGNIVTWSGTDGATVADSGVKVQASSTAMDGASDTQVPTSKNIKTNVTKTAVLTDYTKSTTAKQALTTTDTVNSAFGKIEKRVSDNENNISNVQTSLAVGSSDNGKVLTASYSGGTGSYAWVTPSGGGGTTNYNNLSNKPQIEGITLTGNKSLSDLGIAPASAVTLVSGLNTTGTIKNGSSETSTTGYTASPIISGVPYYKDTTYESKSAVSGGTAVSLCTTGEKYTWNNKQTALTTTQLDAVNSGVNSTKVAQIATNEANISINSIKSSITMEQGYTLVSQSTLYQQGKHIFGNLIIKKDSGNYSDTSETVCTLGKPPAITGMLFCGFGASEWGIESIGYAFLGSNGGVSVKDTKTTNTTVNIAVDYVIS